MTDEQRQTSPEEKRGSSSHQGKGEGLSLEEGMRRLESIVKRLEEGGCTLEESLDIFEEGTKLAIACAKRLHSAQGRIDRLVKEQEQVFRLISEEFEAGEDQSVEKS